MLLSPWLHDTLEGSHNKLAAGALGMASLGCHSPSDPVSPVPSSSPSQPPESEPAFWPAQCPLTLYSSQPGLASFVVLEMSHEHRVTFRPLLSLFAFNGTVQIPLIFPLS